MTLSPELQEAVAAAGRLRARQGSGNAPAWAKFPVPPRPRPFGEVTGVVRDMHGEFDVEDVMDALPPGELVTRQELARLFIRLLGTGQLERRRVGDGWRYKVTDAGRAAQEEARQG